MSLPNGNNQSTFKTIDLAIMAKLGYVVQLIGIPVALWWLFGIAEELSTTRFAVERIDTELKIRVPIADAQHLDYDRRLRLLESK